MGTIALFRRWFGIVTKRNRVAVRQAEGRFYSKEHIEGYYNDLTGKVNSNSLLDEEGIPINVIEGGKRVYFPISIFQYALGLWDLFLESHDEDTRAHFLKLCEWIINAQREDGSWNCFGPIGYKKLTVSSMGQGEAVSVMLRAYKLTEDEKWLAASRSAVAFMLTELKDGGTLLREENAVILEEYADMEGSKKSVLNGWIFSIFGLYDYLKVTEDREVRGIFDQTVASLKANLGTYDTGYWSLYDRTGRLASPAYHDLHICLLNVLADILEEDTFRKQAGIFRKYQKNPIYKTRAVLKKIIQKLKDSPEGILIK